jgi:hypothetical protein
MTYIFRWDRHGRKGKACEILARGTMNSCLVQFEDGYTMVTSRNAVRTSRPRSQGAAPAFDRELEVCAVNSARISLRYQSDALLRLRSLELWSDSARRL